MGRQVTVSELYEELMDECGEIPANAALKIIVQHVVDGDRIKITDSVVRPDRIKITDSVQAEPTRSVLDAGHKVGDPDPTPNDPPFCGARYGHPTGGPWCAWRPHHNGPHVSGDGQQILAVFPWKTEAGFHEDAGKTPEQLNSEAPLPDPEVDSSSETVLWRMAEAVRDRVDNAPDISERELATQVRMMMRLLVAVAERVEE